VRCYVERDIAAAMNLSACLSVLLSVSVPLAAFKKWSGHVVQKGSGSRKDVWVSPPIKNLDSQRL